MKILLVHNRYLYHGGEDSVFEAEADLLRKKGHDVSTYVRHNEELSGVSSLRKALIAVWNHSAYRDLRRTIREIRPDLVHFHNVHFLISPAAYHAAKAEGVPVVQTLHNYRLLCPTGPLFRNDSICEKCLGRFFPWPSVLHSCYYRGSFFAGNVRNLILVTHRLIKTWEKQVDLFIALTDFVKQKHLEGGLAADRIVVKPNFVFDPNKDVVASSAPPNGRKGALFVGRLDRAKGIHFLLRTWKGLKPEIPLTIAGEGPLADQVMAAVAGRDHINWLGQQRPDSVIQLMRKAAFLVFPCTWYEPFGRVAVEAFALGTPVIAARTGGLESLVENNKTGLLFEPGNEQDMAEKVVWAHEHPQEMDRMGQECRQEYEKKYTPEMNYQMLMDIYRRACRIDPKSETGR